MVSVTREVRSSSGRSTLSAASADVTDLPDPAVVECVVQGFKKVRFPAPKGGVLTVVYPIQFAPG